MWFRRIITDANQILTFTECSIIVDESIKWRKCVGVDDLRWWCCVECMLHQKIICSCQKVTVKKSFNSHSIAYKLLMRINRNCNENGAVQSIRWIQFMVMPCFHRFLLLLRQPLTYYNCTSIKNIERLSCVMASNFVAAVAVANKCCTQLSMFLHWADTIVCPTLSLVLLDLRKL